MHAQARIDLDNGEDQSSGPNLILQGVEDSHESISEEVSEYSTVISGSYPHTAAGSVGVSRPDDTLDMLNFSELSTTKIS